MHTIINLSLIATFFALVFLLPFRFHQVSCKLIKKFLALARSRSPMTRVSFNKLSGYSDTLWLRIWGVGSAVAFIILVGTFGGLKISETDTTRRAILYSVSACCSGALLSFLIASVRSFLTSLKGYECLNQCGLRSIWLEDSESPNHALRQDVKERLLKSPFLGIIDINGYKLLGRGDKGVLYDILNTVRDVPVLLLLFKPDSGEVDPERRLTTVFQNLLADLELSEEEFMKRVRETLEAVERLNQNRPVEAQIEVRFYVEKPSLLGLLFDQTAIAMPFRHREGSIYQTPFYELEKDFRDLSLYESFRRNFVRLWNSPLPASPSRQQSDKKTVETPWKASKRRGGSSRDLSLQLQG